MIPLKKKKRKDNGPETKLSLAILSRNELGLTYCSS